MSFAREPLPKATAIQLFKSLFLARRSEEYIVKHYPENRMRTPMHMSMGQEFVPRRRLRGARRQGRRVRLLSQPRRVPGADARHRPVLLRALRPHLGNRRGQGRLHASRRARPGPHAVERRGRHADSRRGRRRLRQSAAGDRPHGRGVLRRRRGRRRRVLGEHQRRRLVPAAGDVRLRGQRLCGRHAARGASGGGSLTEAVRPFGCRHLRGRQRRRRERLFAGARRGREGPSRSPPGLPQHQVLPLPRACRHRHGLELGLSRPGDRRARLDQPRCR